MLLKMRGKLEQFCKLLVEKMRYHGVNEQMKKVAYAFSNARNISAQEQRIESLDFLYTNQIYQLYGFVVVFLKTESEI